MHAPRTAAVAVFLTLALITLVESPGRTQPPRGRFEKPVVISKQQAALLNDEARQLASRAREIRAPRGVGGGGALLQISAPQGDPSRGGASPAGASLQPGDREQLARALVVERDHLKRVRSAFIAMADLPDQREAAAGFFDEFERRYASFKASGEGAPTYGAVVRLLDDQSTAYVVVASSESLTFDLEVRSTPAQASVEYRRTGDPYTPHGDLTSTTLKNLLYAVWFVRAELKGRVQEKAHDPYRDRNHIVHFDF